MPRSRPLRRFNMAPGPSSIAEQCAARGRTQGVCETILLQPRNSARARFLTTLGGRVSHRKHVARLLMKEPTPPPPPDAFEEEEEQSVRPRTDWSSKFKKALDTNPGR